MKRLCLSALLIVALPAFADRLPLPADTPASFKTECGSCHLAYPPALLGAADWRRVMAGLDRHYGDNAALDADDAEVGDFLARNGGNADRYADAGAAALTATAWFRQSTAGTGGYLAGHRVRRRQLRCLPSQAEQGRYGEHDIALPDAVVARSTRMKYFHFLESAVVRARGGGVPCPAPCHPSPACGRLLLLYLRGAGHPTGPIPCRYGYLAISNHGGIQPRMAGIRLPEVKEEGRCFFGPEDKQGVGYPPSMARATTPPFHVSRKTQASWSN
jgi:hypothetical protein